jgi:hypothetical protein
MLVRMSQIDWRTMLIADDDKLVDSCSGYNIWAEFSPLLSLVAA